MVSTMILHRLFFVVMVSAFMKSSQRVAGAPVLENTSGGDIFKPNTNVQDEVNLMAGISTEGETKEAKTKETEASGDNTFANFNPNNTIAYSSSNILPNDLPYDMIFIPSSELPSDVEGQISDVEDQSSDLSSFIDTSVKEQPVEDELISSVKMASESNYGEYYSYIGDWRELSWLTEFSEGSEDDSFKNTVFDSDSYDTIKDPSYDRPTDFESGESEENSKEQTNDVGGMEEAINEVKTRRSKRSLESFEESDNEEEEEVDGTDTSSLSSSSYYDISLTSSEVSELFSSVSEDVSDIEEEEFNEVDPKRADIEKALARYPRPGDVNNVAEAFNDMPFYEGDKRNKRAVDLFKYYAVNFPTLEGMRKRGNDDFLVPFDLNHIADDLVPAASKTKRSLQAPRVENDVWDALEESIDISSYDLQEPFDSESEQSEVFNNDVYMPELIRPSDSREFGRFLPHVISVSPELESRRGHRFDMPDYNEGKYFAYRSANPNPLTNADDPIDNQDVPDPSQLLELYRLVEKLNSQDLINPRKPRMYLPGPHAGYQAYGNEIHRGMFGSKRSPLQKALIRPLPIRLEQVYKSKQRNPQRNDITLNSIDEYLDSEASIVTSSTEDNIAEGSDIST
ncbi:uncharacterized protein [Antedon mediterranea]